MSFFPCTFCQMHIHRNDSTEMNNQLQIHSKFCTKNNSLTFVFTEFITITVAAVDGHWLFCIYIYLLQFTSPMNNTFVRQTPPIELPTKIHVTDSHIKCQMFDAHSKRSVKQNRLRHTAFCIRHLTFHQWICLFNRARIIFIWTKRNAT